MESCQNNKTGFSFADDLMVDITGALFPGLLFIIIILIGVVFPLSTLNVGSSLTFQLNFSGSLWWVIFISLLIVSYVIGHAFFRADVIEPDRRDICRRIREELEKGKNRYQQVVHNRDKKQKDELYDEIEKELRNQTNAFATTLTNSQMLDSHCSGTSESQRKETVEFYRLLKKFCFNATENEIIEGNDYPSAVLKVLFPEEVRRLEGLGLKKSDEDIESSDLNESIQKTLKRYREIICSTNRPVANEGILKMIVCSCILNIQSELGCISANNCTFPYVYYYKYLLKRNLSSYLDEVTWNADNSRSKNVINNYKIEIQMFAPEGYALIRRNESHIRMSSSTWHMAQPSKWLLGIVSFVKFISLITNGNSIIIFLNSEPDSYMPFFTFLIPFSLLLFLVYVQRRITHFIHYQRMREIFYTICIYDDFKDIIADKKKVKRNEKNYNVNVHESKLYLT